eukprot:m51a1_g7143 hypothetical protein (252) ;mRNA; r:306549-313435
MSAQQLGSLILLALPLAVFCGEDTSRANSIVYTMVGNKPVFLSNDNCEPCRKVPPQGAPLCALTFQKPENRFKLVDRGGGKVLVQSVLNNKFLRLGKESRGVYQLSFDASQDQAAEWIFKGYKVLPSHVHFIASRGTYLQTNNDKEIKHYRKLGADDPRTRWILQYQSGTGRLCIRNDGTGQYMMTPDHGVETWYDKCEFALERGAWDISKKQNKFYNGKYKGHVVKIQVVVNNQGIPMDVQGLFKGFAMI